ncbi:hypothetical protein LTS18_001629, partial [Coniosporium uncinatum]
THEAEKLADEYTVNFRTLIGHCATEPKGRKRKVQPESARDLFCFGDEDEDDWEDIDSPRLGDEIDEVVPIGRWPWEGPEGKRKMKSTNAPDSASPQSEKVAVGPSPASVSIAKQELPVATEYVTAGRDLTEPTVAAVEGADRKVDPDVATLQT